MNINLKVSKGEFVVVVGPSGCGKSTLLELIAGLQKPTRGEILFHEKPIEGASVERLMMFQEHALFPWLTAEENIIFGCSHLMPLPQAKERAQELMETVSLKGFGNHRVHELSGGMKHRVALARALAPRPELLLIDEPFPAIDALTRIGLYDELQHIFTTTGMTIIAVTHDVREAACLGDRIVVMSSTPGKIKATIEVPLPRPRAIHSAEASFYAERALQILCAKD